MTKFRNTTSGYVVMPFSTRKFAVVAPDGAIIAETHETMEDALAHAGILNAELDTAELRNSPRQPDTECDGPRF
jgi:hypothetical protein